MLSGKEPSTFIYFINFYLLLFNVLCVAHLKSNVSTEKRVYFICSSLFFVRYYRIVICRFLRQLNLLLLCGKREPMSSCARLTRMPLRMRHAQVLARDFEPPSQSLQLFSNVLCVARFRNPKIRKQGIRMKSAFSYKREPFQN